MIPRLHLFEIEDQAWCPEWLRRAMMGYLRVVNLTVKPYKGAAKPLAELLKGAGSHQILDLCSGSGGPWPDLREQMVHLGVRAQVRCSDRWPDTDAAAWSGGVQGFEYYPGSVCAMAIPEELEGTCTMFSALHHLEPEQVRAVLAEAQRAGRHFAAFEITHRSVAGLLVVAVVPIMALFLQPMVKPRRWLPLVLSYIPPLVPLAIGWDGLVSTLRSYRVEELEAIVAPLRSADYEWRVEEYASGTPLPITSVIGRPLKSG